MVETISRDEPYNFELVELEGTDVISLLKADDFITNVEALKVPIFRRTFILA